MLGKLFQFFLLFSFSHALIPNISLRKIHVDESDNMTVNYFDIFPQKNYDFPFNIDEFVLTTISQEFYSDKGSTWTVRLTSLVYDFEVEKKTEIEIKPDEKIDLVVRFEYKEMMAKIFNCKYDTENYIGEFYIFNYSTDSTKLYSHWRIVKESLRDVILTPEIHWEIFEDDCYHEYYFNLYWMFIGGILVLSVIAAKIID